MTSSLHYNRQGFNDVYIIEITFETKVVYFHSQIDDYKRSFIEAFKENYAELANTAIVKSTLFNLVGSNDYDNIRSACKRAGISFIVYKRYK